MANHLYIDSTPAEVSSAPGLHLITQNTPNGQATQILLEELAAVYGTPFTTTLIDISTNEQKKEWFLRLNPNGRIPVVVDNTRSVAPGPFPIFETSAQLLYLTDHFDKDHKFGFVDPLERSDVEQWLFFWHGGGAPYQGNLNYFARNAPDDQCMFFPPPNVMDKTHCVDMYIYSRYKPLQERNPPRLRRDRDPPERYLHRR